MKRSEITDEEWEAMMDGLCGDCDGFLSVHYHDEPCPGCDGFDEELKELRKEWAEE